MRGGDDQYADDQYTMVNQSVQLSPGSWGRVNDKVSGERNSRWQAQ
jgi:hypothetical protein